MIEKHTAGTYVLVMENDACKKIRIGKRGHLQLNPGYYLYVGSAFGPGGILARTAHHQKVQDSPRWHIDYLRQYADLLEIWYSFDPQKREHEWAGLLKLEMVVPMPGFGSSDCQCTSHLFFSPAKPVFSVFKALIQSRNAEHSELFLYEYR